MFCGYLSAFHQAATREFGDDDGVMRRRGFMGAAASQAAASQSHSETADPIERDRQAALEALKPTKAELERGLAIHRESLVFDAYGFAPRAAPDGAATRALIEQGASREELQDLREDATMTGAVSLVRERQEFVRAWQASGVTCIFQNCGEESSDPLRLIKRLARFSYLTDHLPGVLRRAVTPEDVERAYRDGLGCLYFTGNGVPLTQRWVSVEDELRYVRIFFQLGIRMMHVTYNRRNRLGDGCAEAANGGLSDFGRAAVAEMNRVGVIVDVAHSGADKPRGGNALESARRGQSHDVRRSVPPHPVQAGRCDACNRRHRRLCRHLLHTTIPAAQRRHSGPLGSHRLRHSDAGAAARGDRHGRGLSIPVHAAGAGSGP